MNRAMKAPFSVSLALMTAIIIALPGCGGGSSTASGGGGGSGGTIAGTVNSGVASVEPSGRPQGVFLALAGVMVREARADGVPNVTVELLSNGTVVATTTTDANGNFMFTNLTAGSYTIRLSQSGSVLGETSTLQVGSTTKTNLKLALNGGVISVEVESEGNQISGEVETSQDSSAGQDNSTSDNTATDDSNDVNDDSATDDGNEAADDDSKDGGTTNGGGSGDGEQED